MTENTVHSTIMAGIGVALIAWAMFLIDLIERALIKFHLEPTPLNIMFGWVAMCIVLVSILAIVVTIYEVQAQKTEGETEEVLVKSLP